jgi:hypothetical protein
MIAVKSQPEIEVNRVDDEVYIYIKKVNDYDIVRNEKISFPACHLQEVISALVDVRDSGE